MDQDYIDWFQENKEIYSITINGSKINIPRQIVYELKDTPLFKNINLTGDKKFLLSIIFDEYEFIQNNITKVYFVDTKDVLTLIKFDKEYLDYHFFNKYYDKFYNTFNIRPYAIKRNMALLFYNFIQEIDLDNIYQSNFNELKERYSYMYPYMFHIGTRKLENYRQLYDMTTEDNSIYENTRINIKKIALHYFAITISDMDEYRIHNSMVTYNHGWVGPCRKNYPELNYKLWKLYKKEQLYIKIEEFTKTNNLKIDEVNLFAVFIARNTPLIPRTNIIDNEKLTITMDLYKEFLKEYYINS